MDNKVKIGVRIDESVWQDFREYVRENRHRTRGVLGEEVEIALRERMNAEHGNDALQRIEEDVSTLKAMLAESDGGVPPSSSDSVCTHARGNGSKPKPNQPRETKVEWLIEEHYKRSGGEATEQMVTETVQEVFGFGERTAREYVELFADQIDAKRHPNNSQILRWGDQIQEVE